MVLHGARVWLASGRTDMLKGFDGLALLVQEKLKRDPGTWAITAHRDRDARLPVVAGCPLVVVVVAMVVNLAVDLLYRVIDPRVRMA